MPVWTVSQRLIIFSVGDSSKNYGADQQRLQISDLHFDKFPTTASRVQELQNEVNDINDSKDFQDAESVRSGNSHVTSRPVSVPPHPIPGGMLRHSFVSPRRKEGPPSIWHT